MHCSYLVRGIQLQRPRQLPAAPVVAADVGVGACARGYAHACERDIPGKYPPFAVVPSTTR